MDNSEENCLFQKNAIFQVQYSLCIFGALPSLHDHYSTSPGIKTSSRFKNYSIVVACGDIFSGRGRNSIYAALYFLPIIAFIHSVLGGVVYYRYFISF